MDDYPKYDQIVLDKIKFGVEHMVSMDLLLDTRIDIVPYIADQMRISLRGYLLGEEMGLPAIVEYPRDWWQALKERWFPEWLLNKYPVQYHVVTFNAKAYYPNFKPSIPPDVSTYRIAVMREDDDTAWWRKADDISP